MISNTTLLGKGITFPFVLDSNGAILIESDMTLIRKSIVTILTWPYGTRYMLGEFGSMLNQLLEDPNDLILADLVKHYIIEAISTWETRISALETPVLMQENNILKLQLAYIVTSSAKPDSFIFPLYKKVIY